MQLLSCMAYFFRNRTNTKVTIRHGTVHTRITHFLHTKHCYN